MPEVRYLLWDFGDTLVDQRWMWPNPEGVPGWPAWAAVGLGLVYFAITFGWHLPAHGHLARGEAPAEVMGTLMTSHAVRTVTVALRCGVLLWMASIRP